MLDKFDQEAFYLNSADYAAYARKIFEEERDNIKRMGLKTQRGSCVRYPACA